MIARKKKEIGFAGFLFCVEWDKKRKKKNEKRIREGMHWPVKPEWRSLAGGGLWCWYEKMRRREFAVRLAPGGR